MKRFPWVGIPVQGAGCFCRDAFGSCCPREHLNSTQVKTSVQQLQWSYTTWHFGTNLSLPPFSAFPKASVHLISRISIQFHYDFVTWSILDISSFLLENSDALLRSGYSIFGGEQIWNLILIYTMVSWQYKEYKLHLHPRESSLHSRSNLKVP